MVRFSDFQIYNSRNYSKTLNLSNYNSESLKSDE